MKVEREVHREFQDGGDGEHDDTDIEGYGDLLDSSEIDSASDGDDEDEDDDDGDDDDDNDDMMKRIGKRLENPFDFFGGRGDVEDDDDDDDDDDKIKVFLSQSSFQSSPSSKGILKVMALGFYAML